MYYGDLTSFGESLNISSLTRLPFYLTSLAGITNLRSCHRSQIETQNETVKGCMSHKNPSELGFREKNPGKVNQSYGRQNSKQLCYKHRGHYIPNPLHLATKWVV